MRRRDRWILIVAYATIALAIIALPARAADPPGCRHEPESQWAPAGWVCPPRYGDGIASAWPGPGAAVNWCDWPWDDCAPIRVTSYRTGLSIIVTPTMWCHCYVHHRGPNGEGPRLVDLDPGQRAALGLHYRGLYRVRVEPVDARTGMPDTAMR